MKLSKRVLEMEESVTLASDARAKKLKAEGKDVLFLTLGQPDFHTPENIQDAAVAAIRDGRASFYTIASGLPELKAAVSTYFERYYGYSVAANEVTFATGAKFSLYTFFMAVVNPGDEVIIPQPSFVCYEPITQIAGGTPVTIDLQAKNQFMLTPEELENVITEKSKILILSYPNNPTGATMDREALIKIADVVKKHDLLVITDEIYAELVYDEPFTSIAELPGMRERTIIINGFSKGFAMTGWRLGFMAGPEVFMEQLLKLHQYTIMAAPTASQYAALAGLKNNWQETVEPMRLSYEERRNYLHHALEKMGLPCYKAKGAFYLFPQVSQFGLSSEEFALRLLDEEKLAVVPGSAFGKSGEGFLRLSYAYSIYELKEAIQRLERFVMRLK